VLPPLAAGGDLAQRYVSAGQPAPAQFHAPPGAAYAMPLGPPSAPAQQVPPVQFVAVRPQYVFDPKAGQWMWSYAIPPGSQIVSAPPSAAPQPPPPQSGQGAPEPAAGSGAE
jgi:hypothetical protein